MMKNPAQTALGLVESRSSVNRCPLILRMFFGVGMFSNPSDAIVAPCLFMWLHGAVCVQEERVGSRN